MAQFVEQCLSDFLSNLLVRRADDLDIFLIQKDPVWRGCLKDAFFGTRDPVEKAQQKAFSLRLPRRVILNHNRNVGQSCPKDLGQPLERLLHEFFELSAIHAV